MRESQASPAAQTIAWTAANPPSLWMNTMKRCSLSSLNAARRSLLIATGLLTLGVNATTAQAQGVVRNFPDNALRGTMVVGQPPWITMDGEKAQLSPGARIRGTGNTLVISASLVDQQLVVNYVVAPGGLVHEVWILTEAEAALKRPRASDLQN
jgi:hypothetical protein